MDIQSPVSISHSSINSMDPDFSIVLVCWNNKVYLKPCLDSLYETEIKSKFDIVVVDNGSSDGSQAMLTEEYPDVIVIQNDHNVGLSRASNQGIEATHGRFVLLLNNDTLVNGPSLDSMVNFLNQHPEAGAVGGKLLNPDGSFQAAGSSFPSLHEEFLISTRLGTLFWRSYPDTTPGSQIKIVDWIGSACLLIRRDALMKVGLLDEEYFIYGDEADLQYRLKKSGWKVYYLPSVTTIHYGGKSMDRWRRRKMVYRGKMLFFRKNYGMPKAMILRFLFAVLGLVKLIPWSILYLLSILKERAKKEIISNLEVIKLCWRLV
jgi:N-acetylglucosaminyl-diphospho-decaprenol L-rhamnosyltransferase